MDLLSVIRRWHGRDKLSIREIARRTGLSRHTIRKYLANGVTEPKYPLRKCASKLDPFAETLSVWLKRESGRSRKRRRNLKQLHRDLLTLGYDGSYDRVAAFARSGPSLVRFPVSIRPRSFLSCVSAVLLLPVIRRPIAYPPCRRNPVARVYPTVLLILFL